MFRSCILGIIHFFMPVWSIIFLSNNLSPLVFAGTGNLFRVSYYSEVGGGDV